MRESPFGSETQALLEQYGDIRYKDVKGRMERTIPCMSRYNIHTADEATRFAADRVRKSVECARAVYTKVFKVPENSVDQFCWWERPLTFHDFPPSIHEIAYKFLDTHLQFKPRICPGT